MSKQLQWSILFCSRSDRKFRDDQGVGWGEVCDETSKQVFGADRRKLLFSIAVFLLTWPVILRRWKFRESTSI